MSKLIIVIIVIVALFFTGLALLPKKEVVRIGQQYESEGQNHLSSINQPHTAYKTDPPTSGPHFNQPADWGVSEVEIPDEQLIHNLEHGGVVITYKPDMSEKEINSLRTIATTLTMRDNQEKRLGFKVILAPRAANKTAVQLSSWQYNLKLDSIDQVKIQQFYRDRPLISPEPNAT